MKISKRQLRRIIKEEVEESSVADVQKLVDGNQWLKGSVVKQDDLIDAGSYVVYASAEGLGHIKDRHQDANAPGSLMNAGVNLRELITKLAATAPTSEGDMVKWEGVDSPIGSIGQMGLAAASPEEVAEMKDYTMPGGRNETVKVAAGERKPTDEVTLVTANLGDLGSGKKVLSLVTLYPGGMDVDGVTIPNDRGAFADAGIYFVLPSDSPILGEGKLGVTKRQLKRIIREATAEEMERWESDYRGPASQPMSPAYEDNQTKMVRRYLILRGEESELDRMSQQEIETLAAELRSLPPSTKKRWGIYDLRENKIKTTKRQLRRLIKEEKQKLVVEQSGWGPRGKLPNQPSQLNNTLLQAERGLHTAIQDLNDFFTGSDARACMELEDFEEVEPALRDVLELIRSAYSKSG